MMHFPAQHTHTLAHKMAFTETLTVLHKFTKLNDKRLHYYYIGRRLQSDSFVSAGLPVRVRRLKR
jgi:hypothetical protein